MSITAQETKSALRIWHEELETLLVSTDAFRERCQVVSMLDARKRVYWDEAEAYAYDAADEQHRLRPLAVISGEEFAYQQYGVDSSNAMALRGTLALLLVDNARVADDHKASKADFLDFAGGVLDQMAELSGLGDYAPLTAIEIIGKPMRAPHDQRRSDDYWSVVLACSFSTEDG